VDFISIKVIAQALAALDLLITVAWLAVLLWVVGAWLTLRGLRRQQPLRPSNETGLLATTTAPLVSVLVPARNEENRIVKDCITSILAQDYGHFEVVAVDDRSTDATGPILHDMSRRYDKLRVIDGVEPPEGWLGKPHALQEALDASDGTWVLATDADMILRPDALRTAMAYALSRSFDAVTFIPHVECFSFWERVFMPTFGWYMVMGLPLERVNDPLKPQSLGVGGFFLIRRSALRRVGEYRAVRAEVAEDLRMAELLKHGGARLRIDYAPDLVRTRMQTNLQGIWEGFTKNLFAGTRFNLLQTIVAGIGILLFAVAPPFVAVLVAVLMAAGASGSWSNFLAPMLAVWVIQVFVFAVINWRWSIPPWYALTVPAGHMLFAAILANSAIKVASGMGVTWKGRTLYDRAGVRPPVRPPAHAEHPGR
jgi:chlorobactene glucosyltransferase